MERYTGFHGVTAVAPLKLDSLNFQRLDVRGFHGVTAVAPLKQARPRHIQDLPQGFHGVTAVAPLKPTLIPPARALRAMFPRRHRRGPIEAPGCVSRSAARNVVSTASPPWPH